MYSTKKLTFSPENAHLTVKRFSSSCSHVHSSFWHHEGCCWPSSSRGRTPSPPVGNRRHASTKTTAKVGHSAAICSLAVHRWLRTESHRTKTTADAKRHFCDGHDGDTWGGSVQQISSDGKHNVVLRLLADSGENNYNANGRQASTVIICETHGRKTSRRDHRTAAPVPKTQFTDADTDSRTVHDRRTRTDAAATRRRFYTRFFITHAQARDVSSYLRTAAAAAAAGSVSPTRKTGFVGPQQQQL